MLCAVGILIPRLQYSASALATISLFHHLLVVTLLTTRLYILDLAILALKSPSSIFSLQDFLEKSALPLLLG